MGTNLVGSFATGISPGVITNFTTGCFSRSVNFFDNVVNNFEKRILIFFLDGKILTDYDSIFTSFLVITTFFRFLFFEDTFGSFFIFFVPDITFDYFKNLICFNPFTFSNMRKTSITRFTQTLILTFFSKEIILLSID